VKSLSKSTERDGFLWVCCRLFSNLEKCAHSLETFVRQTFKRGIIRDTMNSIREKVSAVNLLTGILCIVLTFPMARLLG
jgi:hypothetical protein